MNSKMRMDKKGRMINPLVCTADEFAKKLHDSFDWFSGVPDSVFGDVLKKIDPYIASSRENHALSMAFGARLGGAKACILIQNSGLGLLGDALYGLQHLYNVGVVMFVSLRGELEWEEAQHSLWGKNTLEYLKVLEVKTYDIQKQGMDVIKEASDYAFQNEKPVAVIVHRGNIDE